MKLVEHFRTFLNNEVNLNQTRLERLEGHASAIGEFVKGSATFGEHVLRVVPQGSWEHRTIIKPLPNREFDADLALFVEPIADWEPADYIEQLYSVFRSHGTYRDLVHRRTRCVTLDYAGDFHLDIAPIVVKGILSLSSYAQNRRTNEEEPTDPEAYSEWFAHKNSYTRNNMLVKVTRLVKHLRDVKRTFSIPSILLTTILGNQVHEGLFFGDDLEMYTDVPTSLVTILGRLDDYFQEHESPPSVPNPTLEDERFSRLWDQDSYGNLREQIGYYRARVDDAFADTERSTSIAKWRAVFGESFAAGTETAAERTHAGSVVPSAPHERTPEWRMSIVERANVDAFVYDGQRNRRLGGLNSGGRRIAKGLALKFVATTSADPPFDVKWQVVNTGQEASVANDLRGDFYPSATAMTRWETTKYTGCHWVRCFVIKDGTCIAQSDRFVVHIA